MAENTEPGSGQPSADRAMPHTESTTPQSAPATSQSDITGLGATAAAPSQNVESGSSAAAGTHPNDATPGSSAAAVTHPNDATPGPSAAAGALSGHAGAGLSTVAGTPSNNAQRPAAQSENSSSRPDGILHGDNGGRGGFFQAMPNRGSTRGGHRGGRGNALMASKFATQSTRGPLPGPAQGLQGLGTSLGTNTGPSGVAPLGAPTGPKAGVTRGPNSYGQADRPVGGVRERYQNAAKTPLNYSAQKRDSAPEYVDSRTNVNNWTQFGKTGISTGVPQVDVNLRSAIPQSVLGSIGSDVAKATAAAAKKESPGAVARYERMKEIDSKLVYETTELFQTWHRKPVPVRIGAIMKHIAESKQMLDPGQQESPPVDLKTFAPQLGSPATQEGSKGSGSTVPAGNGAMDHSPLIHLWFCDPVRAAFNAKMQDPDCRIVVVNDATTRNEPCGGYESGTTTDYEERLLSKTTLFPRLKSLRASFPLMWNMNEHRVVHTPGVVVWKNHPERALPADDRIKVDVLTCPADDLTKGELKGGSLSNTKGTPGSSVRVRTTETVNFGSGALAKLPVTGYKPTDADYSARMKEMLTEIFRYANACKFDTVILPPYGCDKGHPAKEVASIIRDILFARKANQEQFVFVQRVIIAMANDVGDMNRWIDFRDVYSEPIRNEAGKLFAARIDVMLSRSLHYMAAHSEQRRLMQTSQDQMDE